MVYDMAELKLIKSAHKKPFTKLMSINNVKSRETRRNRDLYLAVCCVCVCVRVPNGPIVKNVNAAQLCGLSRAEPCKWYSDSGNNKNNVGIGGNGGDGGDSGDGEINDNNGNDDDDTTPPFTIHH